LRPTSPDTLRTVTEFLQTHGLQIGAAICALVLMQSMWRWSKGAWRRLKLRRRFARAQRAEDAAAKLLSRRGYRVLDSQPELSWEVRLNGKGFNIDIRADYLVARGRKRYIAEVKTGHTAPSITTSATRRQLLEYLMAYPVDGVILVDMEDESIYHVDFTSLHGLNGQRSGALARGVLLGVVIGAALATAANMYG
jgi:hypothetical protein